MLRLVRNLSRHSFRQGTLARGVFAIFILAIARPAWALPVVAPFVDDPRCDAISNVTMTHEIGTVTGAFAFPVGERLGETSTPLATPVCVQGNADPMDDFTVVITNFNGQSAWTNVFFVADPGISVGNADGTILGLDAFRIDSVGVNRPLLSESITTDGIWQPGEAWTFVVTDFTGFGAGNVFLTSPGLGPLLDPTGSTASIVAIPEPSTLLLSLFALASLALLARTPAGTIRTLTAILLTLPLLGGPRVASAVSVNGLFIDDARCDNPGNQSLSHELGDVAAGGFPISEGLSVIVQPTNLVVCVGDDGLQNDWLVEIRNLSNLAYTNLHFVADAPPGGLAVGNADGTVADLSNAASPPGDAFRIDGTVTLGVNNNLLFESAAADEIFSPGETWQFLITNFGTSAPPLFTSVGVFAGTSTVTPGSNASILATVVPEPSTLLLVALGLAGVAGLGRSRRSRVR